ncbi:MAG: maltose acetyltransferase domain-containing protein [Rikenellaceae bacterium]
MTEKEKMIKGELYDAGDVALVNERTACKELCYDYNHLRPSQTEERTAIMRKLLSSCKETFTIIILPQIKTAS